MNERRRRPKVSQNQSQDQSDQGQDQSDQGQEELRHRRKRTQKKTLREQMGEDEWLRFKEFKKNRSKFICTTRFTDATWQENVRYRNQVFKGNPSKCVYGSPFTLRQIIDPDAIVFVLEMNNDQNKMMGIGLIRNHPICGKHRIYENGNYNRYAFVGTMRISREDMNPEEEEIMKAFDILCFKGSKHMKRGSGINLFPDEILFRCMNTVDLVEFLSGMFRRRITQNKNA